MRKKLPRSKAKRTVWQRLKYGFDGYQNQFLKWCLGIMHSRVIATNASLPAASGWWHAHPFAKKLLHWGRHLLPFALLSWLAIGTGYSIYTAANLPLQQVVVRGRTHTPLSTVLNPIQMNRQLSPLPSSLLRSVDILGITSKLERHPLIETAQVRRVLPSQILVQLTERAAIAMVKTQTGTIGYVDKEGVGLPASHALAANPLPQLVGIASPPIIGQRNTDFQLLQGLKILTLWKQALTAIPLQQSRLLQKNTLLINIEKPYLLALQPHPTMPTLRFSMQQTKTAIDWYLQMLMHRPKVFISAKNLVMRTQLDDTLGQDYFILSP